MAILKRLAGLVQRVAKQPTTTADDAFTPTLIPRTHHTISRDDISDNALKVLYRLHKADFEAYLVGGGVRDLLLGHRPKDFDVVTNATPEEVRKLFRNCRLVGRRFRLAHILFGREIIEVATFRGHHQSSDEDRAKHGAQSDSGMILRDNVYGNRDEDAERRDFTVNALYYNIADFGVYAYAGGVDDLNNRTLRLIGDPATRYREDPVRMLRAVRFASKLGFSLSSETEAPLDELAPMLRDIPPARLFEEVLKLFLAGHGLRNFELLRQYDLFRHLFPLVDKLLQQNPGGREEALVRAVMVSTDARIQADKKVTPAFLFAALLWYPLEARANELSMESGLSFYDAFQIAMNDVLTWQAQRVSIPKRFTVPAREIWQLQLRLSKRLGRRPDRLLEHPRFRAAYDFLEVRGEVEGEAIADLAQWWRRFQRADEGERRKLQRELNETGQKPARKRRRRRRKPAAAPEAGKPEGGQADSAS